MKNGEHIQLRSTAVQAILKKVPNWIVRWGTVVVFLGILFLFVIAYIIRIPERVDVYVDFELDNAPYVVTAPLSGLLVDDKLKSGDIVQNGDLLFNCVREVRAGRENAAIEEGDFTILAPIGGEVVRRLNGSNVELGDTIMEVWHRRPESVIVNFELPKKYYNTIYNKEVLLLEYRNPITGEYSTEELRVEAISVIPESTTLVVVGFFSKESVQLMQFIQYSWSCSGASVVISNPRFLVSLFGKL